MNYYPHHIGDFDKATRHLTRTERSIYRDLIDVYYDTERPLTTDRAALCRLVIARTDEERAAVDQVLAEFFTETADGWFHDRCEEELAKYRKKGNAASNAGKASAARRSASAQQQSNGNSTDVEQPLNDRATNQNQNQNQNQEPEEEQKHAPAALGSAVVVPAEPKAPKKPRKVPWAEIAAMGIPDWLPRKAWTDWVQHRVAVDAPMTPRAAELILKKLGGFRAAGHDPVACIDASVLTGRWTDLYPPKPDARASPAGPVNYRQAENDRRGDDFLRMIGATDDHNTIDMEVPHARR